MRTTREPEISSCAMALFAHSLSGLSSARMWAAGKPFEDSVNIDRIGSSLGVVLQYKPAAGV